MFVSSAAVLRVWNASWIMRYSAESLRVANTHIPCSAAFSGMLGGSSSADPGSLEVVQELRFPTWVGGGYAALK